MSLKLGENHLWWIRYGIQAWPRALLEPFVPQTSSQFLLILSTVWPFFYSANSKRKNHFQFIYFYLNLKVIKVHINSQNGFHSLLCCFIFLNFIVLSYCYRHLVVHSGPQSFSNECTWPATRMSLTVAQHMVPGRSSAKTSSLLISSGDGTNWPHGSLFQLSHCEQMSFSWSL